METYLSYKSLIQLVNAIIDNSNTKNGIKNFGDINIYKNKSDTKFNINKNSTPCDVYLLVIKRIIVGQIRICPIANTIEYRLSYKNIPYSGSFNPTKRNMNILKTYNYNYLPWLDINTKQREKITHEEIEKHFPPEPISNNGEFDENKTIKYSVLEDIGNELIKFIKKQPENLNQKASEHNLRISVANSFYNQDRGKFSKFNIITIINNKQILIGDFIIHSTYKKMPQLYVKLTNNYSIHFDKVASPNIEALSAAVPVAVPAAVPEAETVAVPEAEIVAAAVPPVLSEESPSLLPIKDPKKSVWNRFKGIFSRKRKGGKHTKKTMRNNRKNKRTRKQRK